MFLVVSALPVSAHSNDRNHDRDRDYWHDSYPTYNWQYGGGYSPVVTTPYWCGTYYSSYPCPVYQPYYPQQPYVLSYYPPTTYQNYPQHNQYYSQPGYWNGGAWIPYYNY